MSNHEATEARTFRTGVHPRTGTMHATANSASRGSACNNRISNTRTVNLVQIAGRTAAQLLEVPEPLRCRKCFSTERLTEIAAEA